MQSCADINEEADTQRDRLTQVAVLAGEAAKAPLLFLAKRFSADGAAKTNGTIKHSQAN